MQQIAEITLIENSTAGNQPKVFARQAVEINHESDTIQTGVDGHTARATHPSKVLWIGGTAEELVSIANVKIVTEAGKVLIDGDRLRRLSAFL